MKLSKKTINTIYTIITIIALLYIVGLLQDQNFR